MADVIIKTQACYHINPIKTHIESMPSLFILFMPGCPDLKHHVLYVGMLAG